MIYAIIVKKLKGRQKADRRKNIWECIYIGSYFLG